MELDTAILKQDKKHEKDLSNLLSNEVKSTLGLAKNCYYSDKYTQDELIVKNTGLVVCIASQLSNHTWQIDDYISVGYIGLIKAARTYDCHRDIKFSTYAGKCIKNEILMYKRDVESKFIYNEMPFSQCNYRDSDEFDESIAIDNNLENCFDDYINSDFLNKAISLLYEQERKIIIGYYYGKKTDKQIGKELSVSQPYVSRVRKMTLKKLKDMFNNSRL